MRPSIVALCALILVAPALAVLPFSNAADCSGTSTGLVPLNDLGAGTYKGAQGGLYPGGVNVRPGHHETLGNLFADLVVPRNKQGNVDQVRGSIVMLGVGMSNANQEFSLVESAAATDPVRHAKVAVVNAAKGGVAAEDMAESDAPYWDYVDDRLEARGFDAAQVQAVWLKNANRGPRGSFPAHAETLEGDLRAIVQNLQLRFVNLHMVYVSSRIYAGYAISTLNPEPFAYTSGFSVKWLIESQIDGTYPAVDPAHGIIAPWLSWGPYLWADGLNARSDGLTWECTNYAHDGTHPNLVGAQKVADRILNFLHTDPTAVRWYNGGGRLV